MIRVAAGILRRGGRILICRRPPGGAFAGKWEFPGGKLKEGETFEAALVRELAEELDIAVQLEDLRLLETVSHSYPEGPSVELRFFEVLAFLHEPCNRSFARIDWVDARQAPGFDFLEADRTLVNRLARDAELEVARASCNPVPEDRRDAREEP